ncbi:hypothetical protein HAX54_037845 [Datura stramonium]|uniref:Uncharacterized protein n=1 Tax=Datura stramonium TaxID=4076 RepID=A0ABS8VMB6_DATST|nr:hypothetical protein [Datura stramonium]
MDDKSDVEKLDEVMLPELASTGKEWYFTARGTDSWAICRIFKKTNSMANRALSYPWINPLTEVASPELFNQSATARFGSRRMSSSITENGSGLPIHLTLDIWCHFMFTPILRFQDKATGVYWTHEFHVFQHIPALITDIQPRPLETWSFESKSTAEQLLNWPYQSAKKYKRRR